MTASEIIKEFQALPPEERRSVATFIVMKEKSWIASLPLPGAAKPAGRRRKPKQKLSEFFSVLRGANLDLERIKDYPRDIKL